MIFLKAPIKTNASQGFPPLKMKPPTIKQTPSPPLKNKVSFLEMIHWKKNQELKTAINTTCVSLIKQNWEKIAEIPQKCDFLTWAFKIL